jgi:hypothetical protein
MMSTNKMIALPQHGLWRVSVLLRGRKAGTGEAIVETIGPELVNLISAHRLPVRLVMNALPQSLNPDLTSLFPPLYDGLIEFWSADAQDAVEAVNLAHADPKISAMATQLIDAAATPIWLAEAVAIIPEAGHSNVKFLAAGDVAEGWSVEDAQRYWREVHPVVFRSARPERELMMRYVQFHGAPVPATARPGAIGTWRRVPMCAEMGFENEVDFITNYSDEKYQTIVRPDEEKFARPGEMLATISRSENMLTSGTALDA